MWVTVIVRQDGTVTVRPDKPAESDKSYHAAREDAVFEHRAEMPEPVPGDVYGAVEATMRVLATALASAPLPE